MNHNLFSWSYKAAREADRTGAVSSPQEGNQLATMMNLVTWVLCLVAVADLGSAMPQSIDLEEGPKTHEPLRSLQIPSGVAWPHQQNMDEDFFDEEIPNVEERIPRLAQLGVKGGIKGGVKGGVRDGVKGGGIKGGVKGYGRLTTPGYDGVIRLSTSPAENLNGLPGTLAPSDGPIRVTVQPNGLPDRSDVFVTTPSSLVTENLIRKKTKTIKGGKRGYQYDPNNIRALFANDRTEAPVPTTVDFYNPVILNLPTERIQEVTVLPTTENYRQETVAPEYQQTEPPLIQQTEEPYQQTELPVQQTEQPIRETEPTTQRPYITTVQQTERPTTELYEPVQETQSPLEPQITQRPELPVQTTIQPTTEYYADDQQTEVPQVPQLPDEPIYTTQVPTTVRNDEFDRYPLGLEGRLLIKGGGVGKGKGGKGGKGSKGLNRSRKVLPVPRVVSRGTVGVSSRRSPAGVDPATPLLPSLMRG